MFVGALLLRAGIDLKKFEHDRSALERQLTPVDYAERAKYAGDRFNARLLKSLRRGKKRRKWRKDSG